MVEKPLKKAKKSHEIHKVSTLTSRKNSLKNAIKFRFSFTVILNHLTLVLVSLRDEGICVRPTYGALLLVYIYRERDKEKERESQRQDI